jgi:hypothetical protein
MEIMKSMAKKAGGYALALSTFRFNPLMTVAYYGIALKDKFTGSNQNSKGDAVTRATAAGKELADKLIQHF